MSYSWTAAGQRKVVAYENPRSRRLNVLAAYSPVGSAPALTWGDQRGSLQAHQVVDFVTRIPRLPDKPLVIVLDNGSIHISHVVKEALPALRQQRIFLFYLPPYSPKLNAIEAVFGGIKAHELPERAYTDWDPLEEAIDAGFTAAESRLLAKTKLQLRQAA